MADRRLSEDLSAGIKGWFVLWQSPAIRLLDPLEGTGRPGQGLWQSPANPTLAYQKVLGGLAKVKPAGHLQLTEDSPRSIGRAQVPMSKLGV